MGRFIRFPGAYISRTWVVVVILASVLVTVSLPLTASAATTGTTKVAQAEKWVNDALRLAESGNLKGAHKQYKQFQQTWFKIEDSVKSDSVQAYSTIEAQMGQVEYAFTTEKRSGVVQALKTLQAVDDKYVKGQYTAGQSFQKQDVSLSDFVGMLNQTSQWVNSGQITQALSEMTKVRTSWLSVEGSVVAQSQTVYTTSEQDMAEIVAMLKANPPDTKGATARLDEMKRMLSPLAGTSGYSIWDAAMIPVREGLEALLVVAALLAFVKRSEQKKAGRVMIWAGVGAGLLVSIVLAVIVKLVFSSGAFGSNNFLISGWTGVFAAVMLLYMSYWLHSKSSVKEWNQYIQKQSSAALHTGRMVSLGLLSFLAIFREGTETVLFFIGMVNDISLRHLILGLLLGLAVLAAIAYILIGIGMRLPIRPFFLISSLIVFYLCIKFAGMGIHSLQLGGTLPTTLAPGVPTLNWLAVYPTWQSTAVQLAIVLFAITILLIRKFRLRHRLSFEKGS